MKPIPWDRGRPRPLIKCGRGWPRSPSNRRLRTLACAALAFGLECARAAEPTEKDAPVKLPPVIVDGTQPNVKPKLGPRWRDDLLAPGVVLKLAHPTRVVSVLFDENNVARLVVGTKEDTGAVRASFTKTTWRLDDEWLVMSDAENRRVEELRLVHDGWLGLTAARRSGELLRFRVTKPRLSPVKVKARGSP